MANEKWLIDAKRYKESVMLTMRCWNISPCLSQEEARKAVNNLRTALNILDQEPTVDAVEVVHGRWIWKDGKCFCSVCSKQGEPKQAYQDGTVDEYPYCPNCGAKMDGDKHG